MVSIIHSRDNAKIAGKTSKNVKIKLQRNVAINIKKKISLSVTGFEPAISRFVAERVIRCATRMCCWIVKKMGIRRSRCFVLYFFPRKLRSNCG